MTIGAPRFLLVGLAALFSSYHIVLGFYSFQLGYYYTTGPIIAAMVLYAIATAALLLVSQRRTPIWLASFAFAVSLSLPLLVTCVTAHVVAQALGAIGNPDAIEPLAARRGAAGPRHGDSPTGGRAGDVPDRVRVPVRGGGMGGHAPRRQA